MRVNRNMVEILELLLDISRAEWWGFEIASVTGIPTPTVYGILARLERAGWAKGRFEEIDPRAEGRPARRLYKLTPDGAELARSAIAEWEAGRPAHLRLRRSPA